VIIKGKNKMGTVINVGLPLDDCFISCSSGVCACVVKKCSIEFLLVVLQVCMRVLLKNVL
jgi:hypothetical protein